MTEKSKGQDLVERLAAWLSSYVCFGDPGVALVLALWVVHTWVSEHMEATPYLSITSAGPACGKTRLMTVLAAACRNAKVFADVTPAYLFRWMGEHNGHVTIFADEAEKLSGSALGLLRSMMNTGYLAGQTVGRVLKNGTEDFPVFCPKVFAAIGDVNPVLRTRSIVLTLEAGRPLRDLRRLEVLAEGLAFQTEIRHAFANGLPAPMMVDWLDTREREIWSALFGVAVALGCDGPTLKAIRRTASELVMAKSAPRRRHEVVETEDDGVRRLYGEKALRDLQAAFREGERAVFSVDAVARMCRQETGGWRVFKGVGLNADSLADLVSRFGVRPRTVKVAGKALKGYQRRDVMAGKG